jgi:hypothetical protein
VKRSAIPCMSRPAAMALRPAPSRPIMPERQTMDRHARLSSPLLANPEHSPHFSHSMWSASQRRRSRIAPAPGKPMDFDMAEGHATER